MRFNNLLIAIARRPTMQQCLFNIEEILFLVSFLLNWSLHGTKVFLDKYIEDVSSIVGNYLNISTLFDFSLSQAHAFLFIYWSINYGERVTNKRVVLLIASVKIVIFALLFLCMTLIDSLPEPNRSSKWLCSLSSYEGEHEFYFSNVPYFLNFILVILIALYNFYVVRKIMNRNQVVPIPTISQNISFPSSLERKLKNAKIFFKINISTISLYTPTLPMHIFLSYFSLSGVDCDSFEHTRTLALVVGPLFVGHLLIFPIITQRKLKRFYNEVIHQSLVLMMMRVPSHQNVFINN